jgi:hypothetical protein
MHAPLTMAARLRNVLYPAANFQRKAGHRLGGMVLTDALQDVDEIVIGVDLLKAACRQQALHHADVSGTSLVQRAAGEPARGERIRR